MTDAKEPSRMEQKLAETDRIGIIGLRNDLLAGGAFPPTVEHVIDLLTSRTLTIYFYADQCRKKEAEVATLTRERDEAVDRGLEFQAQLMTMLVQRDEARETVLKAVERWANAANDEYDITHNRLMAALRDYRASIPPEDA